MNESPQEPTSEEITAVTAGDFLKWYEQQGEELDAEAALLQQQAAANPHLLKDPEFRAKEAFIRGQKELLERTGEDFSTHTINKMGGFLLEKAFEMGEEPSPQE